MINAEVVADSISEDGDRITTMVLTFPRFILAEHNTHRMFSRNAASSRAIPAWKVIKNILSNPVRPIIYGGNTRGMSEKGQLPRSKRWACGIVWTVALYFSCLCTWLLSKLGLHKQWSNRLIENFSYIKVIVTATDWSNFFNLRCNPAAQPEMQALAYKMLEAYSQSTPKKLHEGEWHIPFGDKYLAEFLTVEELIKISVARCARVSYLNFEGHIDHEKDYALHDKLLKDGHCSPFEHVARPMTMEEKYNSNGYSGNFFGWIQYRKTLPKENRQTLDKEDILKNKPEWIK